MRKKPMKNRFKNWYTTAIGAVLMALTVYLVYIKATSETSITFLEIVMTAGLGWIFLVAKDTLIEGLLGGLIKIKDKIN